jgi:ribosomal protein S27E
MGTVIKFPERHFVRFFDGAIECPDCESSTPGYVFEGSASVVCHVCRSVLIEFEAYPSPLMSVSFFSEMTDGEGE